MENSSTIMANQVSHNFELPYKSYGGNSLFFLDLGWSSMVDGVPHSVFIFSKIVLNFGVQDNRVAGGGIVKWNPTSSNAQLSKFKQVADQTLCCLNLVL
jgi:hypothetical protein